MKSSWSRMTIAVAPFFGLALCLAYACGSSSDPVTPSQTGGASGSGGSAGSGGGGGSGGSTPTDNRQGHFGCAQKAGVDCTKITSEADCTKDTKCSWQYEQCLPNGGDCRSQKNKASCEGKADTDACAWYSYGRDGCKSHCSIHGTKDECEGHEADKGECAWNENARRCQAKTSRECPQQDTEETCKTVPGCRWNPMCGAKESCFALADKAACDGRPDTCEWMSLPQMGDMCVPKCVKNMTRDACSKAAGCKWNGEYFCDEEKNADCSELNSETCGTTEGCAINGGMCGAEVECRSFKTDDECTAHAECTLGICDQICNGKHKNPECKAIDKCDWINIKFNMGERCTTACHEKTVD